MFEKMAKVERILYLRKGFRVKWAWKPVFFKSFEIREGINPHMLIVGESGSGKSNASKQVISELAKKGYNFAIFDPHDEYVDIAKSTQAKVYDAAYTGINIFDLDGMSAKEKSSELTELFRRIFKLGEVQSNILYKVISYTYEVASEKGVRPSINSLIYSIKVFLRNSSSTREKLVLNTLEKRFMLANSTQDGHVGIEKLLDSRSIFALSSLHTSEAQEIYIEGMLRKIYTRMLASEKERLRFYILIDEVEKLGQSTILARLANEGRKYGIGIIAVAQHAKEVEKSIRGNASLVMSFYQREPEELNYISNMIAGGNELERFAEVKKAIRRLRQGEAVVLGMGEPEIVRFRLFDGEEYAPYYIYKLAKEPIKEESLQEELAKRGFGNTEIDKGIKELASEGVLAMHHIDAQPYYGNWYMLKRRNSAEHDICVELISMHLKKLGIGNRIYNSSYGPDIVARINGLRVAIEYETGKKSPDELEKMLGYRKKRFERIIVVANERAKNMYRVQGIELFGIGSFLSMKSLG
ncbi:MAG: ATP-binding protein [Candidatus Micrarchaeia archaeon]